MEQDQYLETRTRSAGSQDDVAVETKYHACSYRKPARNRALTCSKGGM